MKNGKVRKGEMRKSYKLNSETQFNEGLEQLDTCAHVYCIKSIS